MTQSLQIGNIRALRHAVLARHEPMQQMCRSLRLLSHHLIIHGADSWTSETARTIRCFFDQITECYAAEKAEQLAPSAEYDALFAEESLFRKALSGVSSIREELNFAWRPLRSALLAIESGNAEWLRKSHLLRFIRLCQQHIAYERKSILPLLDL